MFFFFLNCSELKSQSSYLLHEFNPEYSFKQTALTLSLYSLIINMLGRNPRALTLTNQNEACFLLAEEQCHKTGTELQSIYYVYMCCGPLCPNFQGYCCD